MLARLQYTSILLDYRNAIGAFDIKAQLHSQLVIKGIKEKERTWVQPRFPGILPCLPLH